MNNKKKVIIAIFITILIGVLTILGSFAFWTSTVGNNINVAFNTANLNNYIDYTAGKAVFAGNLETTNVYSGGTSTIFKINKKNNPAYPFYASLNIKINNISKILTESRVLKWTVTSKASGTNDSEVVVAQSDFVGTKVGDIIQLVPNLEVTTTSTDYNVYLWVDSTNANASSVSGEKIDIELWMDVYQYRAPKVLDVYCHNDGVSAMCNILDSEKSLSQYLFGDIFSSNSYTNISSSNYWTSIDNNHNYSNIIVKTSDGRIGKTSDIYKQVEYIESNGTQYIDTGFIPNQDTSVELHFSTSKLGNQDFFGTSKANDAYAYGLYDGSSVVYDNYNDDKSIYNGHISGEMVVNKNKNVTTVTGDYNFSYTHSSGTFAATHSLYLFARWKSAGAYRPATMACYSFKIWDNGTLVRNFIPCIRLTDNVVGLYDTINNTFYTNSGTGVFTAGPDV